MGLPSSRDCGERNHSDASSLPKPWIAPATLPRRSELQIIALSQVTTVVSRSFSKLSKVEKPRG